MNTQGDEGQSEGRGSGSDDRARMIADDGFKRRLLWLALIGLCVFGRVTLAATIGFLNNLAENRELERLRVEKSDGIERERIALERFRIETVARSTAAGGSTTQEASLLVLRDFLQKLDRGDLGVDPEIATKLIDSMAQAGTITAATAKELTSEIGKEAVKRAADGTKQIVVHLATTLIDRFLKKEEKQDPVPKDHVLTPASPVVVNVNQSNACGCSPSPRPCIPPGPPHPPPPKPGYECKPSAK